LFREGAPPCPNFIGVAHLLTVTDVNNNQTADIYRYDANGNMTCRIESGETFLQTYNVENQKSGIALASGDCDTPGTLLKTWIYTYDGDGNKVKQVYTEGTSTLTTYYYPGGSYEVQTDGSTQMIRHAVFAPPERVLQVEILCHCGADCGQA
jgi:YD repeat-containing protein